MSGEIFRFHWWYASSSDRQWDTYKSFTSLRFIFIQIIQFPQSQLEVCRCNNRDYLATCWLDEMMKLASVLANLRKNARTEQTKEKKERHEMNACTAVLGQSKCKHQIIGGGGEVVIRWWSWWLFEMREWSQVKSLYQSTKCKKGLETRTLLHSFKAAYLLDFNGENQLISTL